MPSDQKNKEPRNKNSEVRRNALIQVLNPGAEAPHWGEPQETINLPKTP